jgi:hypothetical protein
VDIRLDGLAWVSPAAALQANSQLHTTVTDTITTLYQEDCGGMESIDLLLSRHRLPAPQDHMLAFIYLAYSMMALLCETVPAFEDTWIEYLDFLCHQMAIEDDDIREMQLRTAVDCQWHTKASDKSSTLFARPKRSAAAVLFLEVPVLPYPSRRLGNRSGPQRKAWPRPISSD